MNKTNKKAISPIVATILLVVVAVILITIILSWGRNFSNKALATTDTEAISKSNSENFVYTKSFSDGVVQFNYDPVGDLKGQEITIIGYKIIAGSQETEYVAFDPVLSLSAGLNVFELLDFSDLNITERKMDVIFYTSDGKYITLRNITNPSPYVAPVIEPCSLIPENGEINYLEHLAYIDTNVTTRGASYTLMRDLDFDDDASYCEPETYKTTWTTGTGWNPIGTSAAKFTGSLDGNNHKISNLYINRPTTDNIGLFGYKNNYQSTLNNIRLENTNIVGKNSVGSLVGYNYGSISNCSSSGSVTGINNSGGLVGYLDGGNFLNNFSNCSVDGNFYIGGLVGQEYTSTISNSYFLGSVSGINDVGGIIGYQHDGEINNSFSIGSVSGIDSVGGLAGSSHYGIIRNSYSLGDVTRLSGTSTNFGGFISYNSVYGEVSNCYSTGRVIYAGATNPTDRGFSVGVVGSGNYWDMTTSLQTTSAGGAVGKTTSQMKTQSTFTGWDFSTVWNIAGATYPYLRNNTEKLIPSITNPANDSEYQGGININFVGTAINPQGDYTCSWDSNYDGSLGTGCNINVGTLSYRKTHKITLSVTDEEQTKTTYIYAIIGDTYGDP